MGSPPTKRDDCITLIHPLFRKDMFPNKDKTLMDVEIYDNIVRRPAILASRLLDSPQALHYFYGTYFRRNCQVPGTWHEVYVSGKSVTELSLRDIEATRKQLILLTGRVSFEFAELQGIVVGQRNRCTEVTGVRGCKSAIQLSMQLYSAAQNKDRTDDENAEVDFQIAITMLHELAHAVHNDVQGSAYEDCFEDSFVAEAGYELAARIFGMATWGFRPNRKTTWFNWQSRYLQLGSHDLDGTCYDQRRLPKKIARYEMDPSFIQKLFDKGFWDGEYATRGGVALLPAPVIDLCREIADRQINIALPFGVVKLWMESDGISYYQEPCPYPPNENFEIRKKASEAQNDGP